MKRKLKLCPRASGRTWVCMGVTAALLAATPLWTLAMGLSGESATYVRVKKVDTGARTFPIYEYLNLTASDAKIPSLSFHAGGWGRLDLSDQGYDERTNGDLQHAYLLYRGEQGNFQAKAGRLTVFEGVAAERIDGLSASTDLMGGFSASFFLGKPVQSSPNAPSGDFEAGFRVGHSLKSLYTLGMSALQEKAGGERKREEVGLDLSFTPHKLILLTGRSAYNTLTDGWMDNSYSLFLGPFENVTVSGEISKINYRDSLSRTTSSAFAFNPTWIRSDESLLILGDSITLDFPDRGSLSVDYRNYDYSKAGTARSYGVRGTLRPADGVVLGASIRRMSGADPRLDYSEVRLFGQKRYGHLDLTADFFDVKYRRAINGVTNTYTGSLACGYEISQSVKIGADGTFFRSPEVRNGFDLLAKVQVAF